MQNDEWGMKERSSSPGWMTGVRSDEGEDEYSFFECGFGYGVRVGRGVSIRPVCDLHDDKQGWIIKWLSTTLKGCSKVLFILEILFKRMIDLVGSWI